MLSLFFDTYAFYEIIVGNQKYLKYTKDVKIVTTQLNMMEFYYQLITLYDKKIAETIFKRYEEFIVPISNSIIIEAMDFRKKYNKRNLSYVDCVGYVISKKMGIRFLTGDKQFSDLPNVEYIK